VRCYGHAAIAKAIELGHPAGLEPRGDHDGVGPTLKQMRKGFIVADPHADVLGMVRGGSDDSWSEGTGTGKVTDTSGSENHGKASGVRWVADLVGFSMLGDASADGWLQDGDVIHVPAAMSMGGVWGAVSDSGSRELAVHEHLGDVCFQKGRLKDAIAQWETSLREFGTGAKAEMDPVEIAKIQKKLDRAPCCQQVHACSR